MEIKSNLLAMVNFRAIRQSIPPMKNWSGTNANFKNRSSERVYLKNRSTAILIHCSWSFFETFSFTWFIFETRPFTWSVFHLRDRNAFCNGSQVNHGLVKVAKFNTKEKFVEAMRQHRFNFPAFVEDVSGYKAVSSLTSVTWIPMFWTNSLQLYLPS